MLKALISYAEIHDKAIIAIGTAFIAVFTIILAFATLFLWRATRSLVRGASDTSERQLRAYVAIQSGGVFHANVDNSPGLRVAVQLKNSGLTPAYSFTTWIMAPQILSPDAIPFTSARPLNERTSSSVFGPGADTWITWYMALDPDEADRIRHGTRAIFVWGGADYTDAFGKKRRFFFRQSMTGTEDSAGGWSLRPHPLGYEAD